MLCIHKIVKKAINILNLTEEIRKESDNEK
jgi:hypothetical protein